jgi:hypothetical protein
MFYFCFLISGIFTAPMIISHHPSVPDHPTIQQSQKLHLNQPKIYYKPDSSFPITLDPDSSVSFCKGVCNNKKQIVSKHVDQNTNHAMLNILMNYIFINYLSKHGFHVNEALIQHGDSIDKLNFFLHHIIKKLNKSITEQVDSAIRKDDWSQKMEILKNFVDVQGDGEMKILMNHVEFTYIDE